MTRPEHVTFRAFDRDGNEVEFKGSGLLARAFCHEIEHLDGHAFVEKAERFIDPEEE